MLVVRDGRPVPNAMVEQWFSDRHGGQSYHWTGVTNRSGYCTTLGTIPRDWVNGIQGEKTWVDLNAACNLVGAAAIWRIKNK